jgi:hypothetical protein
VDRRGRRERRRHDDLPLAALFGAYATVLTAGLALPTVGTAGWWWSRPLWIAALALVCASLVALFRWAERPRRVAVTGGGAAGAAVAMACLCVGVLGVATTGLDGLLAGRCITLIAVPMTAAAGLALAAGGWALLAWPGGAGRRARTR